MCPAVPTMIERIRAGVGGQGLGVGESHSLFRPLTPIPHPLFNYFKVYPLRRRAVLIFGERIGDDDL
jgi:hypothetical protein